MALDPTNLKQIDLVRLLNSTPLGPVITTRQMYRHRESAGIRIGSGQRVNLFKYVAWLVNTRHAKPKDDKPNYAPGYEGHRDRNAARSLSKSESVRDIGELPRIKDVQRRDACRFDLKLFCETYNPEAFYFGWSPDHVKVIERIEEAVLQGALYAFACPRGAGKTTICRMACLWAVSYAHSRYVFIVAANASKAGENLDAVKVFVRFLPIYADDFPEVSFPIQQLGGISNRASGQLCGGESTLITWNNDRVALPTVPKLANWNPEWPSTGNLAPTSGILIGVSGLTGDGIRGSLHTLTTGEMVRPDFVLLDDPQTDESARSRSQNVTRERLISGAVLGMAGPGRSISAVMPCTVIAPDDMVDRVLDRKKHPLWRGERTKMLRTIPKNMTAWDRYFEVYRDCALREPPDFDEANRYYEANREVLDAEAEPSWPECKLEGEVSAVQHAMNIYCRDPYAFFAEYQNEPVADETDNKDDLTAEQIAAKTNNLKRGVVPVGCNHVTAFIDVQQNLLFFVVVAWQDDFTGYVVAYGSYPDQRRSYFTLKDARHVVVGRTRHWSRRLDLCGVEFAM